MLCLNPFLALQKYSHTPRSYSRTSDSASLYLFLRSCVCAWVKPYRNRGFAITLRGTRVEGIKTRRNGREGAARTSQTRFTQAVLEISPTKRGAITNGTVSRRLSRPSPPFPLPPLVYPRTAHSCNEKTEPRGNEEGLRRKTTERDERTKATGRCSNV